MSHFNNCFPEKYIKIHSNKLKVKQWITTDVINSSACIRNWKSKSNGSNLTVHYNNAVISEPLDTANTFNIFFQDAPYDAISKILIRVCFYFH